MKKLLKMAIMTFLISTLLSTYVLPATFALAANSTGSNPDNIIGGINVTPPSSEQISGLQGMAGSILGILQVASAIAAVVLIAIFGFKFILGSPQEKPDYMKSFVTLIVGVVVVFAASSLAKLIFSVSNSVTGA